MRNNTKVKRRVPNPSRSPRGGGWLAPAAALGLCCIVVAGCWPWREREVAPAVAPDLPPGAAPVAGPVPPAAAVPGNARAAAVDAADEVSGAWPAPPDEPLAPALVDAVPASALVVAPDGRSEAAGTMEDPLDLAGAVARAGDGAVIALRGGIHRVRTPLQPHARIELRGWPGEQPVVSGAVPVADWRPTGPGRWSAPWEHAFPPAPRLTADFLDPARPEAALRDQVLIDGRALRQVVDDADLAPGRFRVDAPGRRLVLAEDPAGRRCEAVVATHGLELLGDRGAAGTRIRGIAFRHFGDQGLTVRADGVVVEDAVFAWGGQRGVDAWRIAGLVFRRCAFIANGRVGLRVSWARGLVVDACTASWNNQQGFATKWDAAGMKITQTGYGPDEGPRITGCELRWNRSTALWLDIDANDAVVTANRIEDNLVTGVFFEISRGAVIAGNRIARNGIGVMVSNASGAEVWSNTLDGNRSALLVKETQRRNTEKIATAGVPVGGVFTTRGNRFARNLVRGGGTPAAGALRLAAKAAAPAELVDITGNAFVLAENIPLVGWTSGGTTDLRAGQAECGILLGRDPGIVVRAAALAAAPPQPGPLPEPPASIRAAWPGAGDGAGAGW